MISWQDSGEVSAEAIKRQQRKWQITLLRSKLDSKKTTRKDFDKMPFMWRSKFLKNGGKVRD